MRSNIAKLYIVNLLSGLVFWYAVEKLFMVHIGITAFGISINAVVMVVASGLLEVPSGVLADRWNRKYTLALGSLALAISSIIGGLSHSLTMYLLSTVIYSFYLSFTSGTFQAITYDTLKELGREGLYAKHQGGSYAMFMVGAAISAPLGGYIANAYNYRSAYFASAFVAVVTLLIILTLHEPTIHKSDPPLKLYAHIGQAGKLLLNNKVLMYLSGILVATGILHNSIVEYAGLYFIAIGFGAIGNGWADGGKWLAGATGQYLSDKMAKWLVYLIPLFFVAFAIFSSWRTPLGLAFFFLATSIYSVIYNETQALVQDQLPSSVRATALSLIAFSVSALTVPLGLAFGAIADHSGVFRAYQLFALIGIIYGLIWLAWQRKIKVMPLSPVAHETSVIPH